MKNFCAFCEHYIGGGDWNLCCRQRYELCYADTEACEKFKEDPIAKRAFSDGIRMYKAALKNKKPVTNADRIRAMTDEELARETAWLIVEAMKQLHPLATWKADDEELISGTAEEMLDWLKQPVEEENE